MKTKNTVWILLLMVSCGLFLIGLNTNNYLYNVFTIVIAFVVYRKGYVDLFGEYDKKQKEKIAQSKQVYNDLYKAKQK